MTVYYSIALIRMCATINVIVLLLYYQQHYMRLWIIKEHQTHPYDGPHPYILVHMSTYVKYTYMYFQ